MASALSVIHNVQPRNVPILELQEKLITAGSKVLYFSDVAVDNFYYPYVTKLALRNILSGYGDFSFKPNKEINNFDMTMMFAKATAVIDHEQHKDISALEYSTARNLLKEKNILDESFKLNVDQAVRREELAHVISRFIDPVNKYSNPDQYFVDVKKGTKYSGDISKLAGLNIVSTTHGRFRPGDKATRAEAVTMLGKAMEYSSSL